MLTCEVHTSLPVTTNLLSVQWMHRGSLVTGSGGFVLKQGSGAGASVYVAELTLNETTVEHSGLYSCHVSTDRQQVTGVANLTVACEWLELNCHHLVVCNFDIMQSQTHQSNYHLVVADQSITLESISMQHVPAV